MDILDRWGAERQHPDPIVGVLGIVCAVGVSGVGDKRLVSPDDELAVGRLDVECAFENVERLGLFVVVVIRQCELVSRLGRIDAQADGRTLVIEARRRADRADVGVAVIPLFEGVGIDMVIAHGWVCGRTSESVSTGRRLPTPIPRHTCGAGEPSPMPTEHEIRVDGERVAAAHHAADGGAIRMTLLARVRRVLAEDAIYECRHCGTTLESELDECPYCGTRDGVVRYELG